MKRLLVNTSIGAALVTFLLLPLQGCTNLDEVPISDITKGNFFHNEAEVLAALAGVYSQLRGTLDDYYNVSEISTDEMVVPTRGQDWYDNGQWLETHRQTWTANSVFSLAFGNGIWNTAYAGVARANVFIEALQNVTVPNKASIVAEARGLRAFYYYILMDAFGGVPIVTTTDIVKNPRNTRREVFDFIESELIAARADLPATRPSSDNGRFTQGAADAILANMYINAGVFTKDAGISTGAYNSCSGVQVSGGVDACAAAIASADAILNSGVYQLADTFQQNFRADNYASPENIFAVKFVDQAGLGLNFVMRALHYSQFNPSPWNGFATLAEAYNTFDPADRRRQVILIGQQYNVLTGDSAFDRAGNPLVFTDTIHDITQATEGEGPRVYKWPASPAHVAQDNGNDFAWFRLGEIYLIKAEALNEQSAGSAAALVVLNTLRARDFNPPQPLAVIDRSVILNERLFELIGEGKRRQDLIRFGTYTTRADDPSMAGGKVPTADYYVLLPIPQTQLDANPQLVQNSGY